MVRLNPLHIAALVFALCLGESCHLRADAWTDREVALGRLCWNEASQSRADCIAIVQARGSYDVATLRRMHARALNPHRTDSRRWIAGLDATMTMPAHWPDDRVPWATRGVQSWAMVLDVVRRTLRGELSVCSERPQAWGSRTIDAERLARVMARGGREVCRGTSNLFFRFGGGL